MNPDDIIDPRLLASIVTHQKTYTMLMEIIDDTLDICPWMISRVPTGVIYVVDGVSTTIDYSKLIPDRYHRNDTNTYTALTSVMRGHIDAIKNATGLKKL